MDRLFLEDLLQVAIDAAVPSQSIAAHLPERPKGRTVVNGAGKASAQMAAAFEEVWGEPVTGLIVTRYGHGCMTRWIEVVEASHPVPDMVGYATAQRMKRLATGLTEDDLVVALISRMQCLLHNPQLLVRAPPAVSLASHPQFDIIRKSTRTTVVRVLGSITGNQNLFHDRHRHQFARPHARWWSRDAYDVPATADQRDCVDSDCGPGVMNYRSLDSALILPGVQRRW